MSELKEENKLIFTEDEMYLAMGYAAGVSSLDSDHQYIKECCIDFVKKLKNQKAIAE